MVLSTQDAGQFFQLLWGLYFYVNQHQRLVPNVHTRQEYEGLPSQQKVKVRQALWQHPEWIEAYVQANPDNLSDEALAIVRGWQKRLMGKFYILRYLKHHAIFLQGERVYGVKALYEPLDMVLQRYDRLPIMVEAVLLPFKGHIIYDGVLHPYNIALGAGIRAGLNETYMTAKQQGRILLTLEQAEPAPKKPSARRLPAVNNAQQVDELVRLSQRLKGQTAPQQAAFNVLRHSALLAEAAATQPDNLAELWLLGRKVAQALNRLEKTLDRAEI